MKTLKDTKAASSSQPKNNDYLNENLTATEDAVMFDNGPESPDERVSNEAVKGGAWLLGILGVFAVCLLIAWVIDMNHSPFSSYASRSVTKHTEIQHSPAANPQAATQLMAIVVPVSAPNTQAAAPAAEHVRLVKGASATTTQADQDRITREALEVIHGDFGNNPGRRAKLGADYAAVQAKVNQLLHI